jgi:hypothetical protein
MENVTVNRITYGYCEKSNSNIFIIKKELNNNIVKYKLMVDEGFSGFYIHYYYEDDDNIDLDKIKNEIIDLSFKLHTKRIKEDKQKFLDKQLRYNTIFKNQLRIKKLKNIIQ